MEFQELQRHIHQLANLDEADEPIISCYLNLQTRYRELFTERIRSLKDRIERARRPAFWEAVGLAEVFIGTGIRPESKGAAIFCRCGNRPYFQALQFGAPLPNSVTVNRSPQIYHLVALKDNYDRYVVMLSSETVARFVEVNLGTVTETIRKERESGGQTGRGWTRERYENRHEEQIRRFVNEQVKTLNEVMAAGEYHHFFVAGEPKMTSHVQRGLPKRLASMLVGVLRASTTERTSDLVEVTQPLFLEFENRESLAVADRLRSEINGRGLAVTGTAECIKALIENRARMLVISTAYAPESAWSCHSCNEVAVATAMPSQCVTCKNRSFSPVDVREEIVRLAGRHGHPIEIVEHSSTMDEIGGVGCFLRYQALDQFHRPVA